MGETPLHCLHCDYNLTGLACDVCPECGMKFDIEYLRTDPELRRVGTPVYGHRGWTRIPKTAKTLLLMLLRPRSFACRFRPDEPVAPPLIVFLTSLLLIFLTHEWGWRAPWLTLYGVKLASVTAALILLAAVAFATFSTRGRSEHWGFGVRFRFWCSIACYSSVFIPAWVWFCAGIRCLDRRDYLTQWPVFYLHPPRGAYAASIVLLWWTAIICIVLWYRSRPRWLALILMIAAYLFVRSMVQFVDLWIPRLARD